MQNTIYEYSPAQLSMLATPLFIIHYQYVTVIYIHFVAYLCFKHMVYSTCHELKPHITPRFVKRKSNHVAICSQICFLTTNFLFFLTISHRMYIQLCMLFIVLTFILDHKITIEVFVIASMLVCPLNCQK